MASIRYYQNGAGGSTGADYAILRPTYASGTYWYVGNAVAGASDGNAGTERGKPLLTTAQAYANASSGNDTIVFLQNHAEAIGSNLTIAKTGLSFVGEGTGSSKPRFTCNVAGGVMWTLNGGTVALFDNLYFPASTAGGSNRISVVVAPVVTIRNCQFDCGALDTVATVTNPGGNFLTITGSSFSSVASQPAIAVSTGGGNDLAMDSVVFDGGAFGWSDFAFKQIGAIARLRATRISQLNGSHALMVTGGGGVWQQQATSGDSRVDWTP